MEKYDWKYWQSGTTMNAGDNGVGIYGSGSGDIALTMSTGITSWK